MKKDKEKNKENNKIITALNQEVKDLTPNEAIKEEHYLIVDEWYNNGFNGSGAVQKFRPMLNESSAKVTFNTISKLDHVKSYINEKRQELRATTNIHPQQVIKELITWLYSDATNYIGLTPQQVRDLPNEVKRCIQSIKHRKKEYQDRQGNTVIEENLEVRIIDKTKAVEILNKMLGNYALDNKQKATNVNIQNNIMNMSKEDKLKYLNALELIHKANNKE